MGDVREFVVQAQAGNCQAFANLYDQFAPLIRSVCYDTTGCLQESEDLCQEVFLSAYRKLGQLRDASRFAGWLMMIARHTCASWRRARRRPPEIGLEGIGDPPESCDARGPRSSCDDEVRRLMDAVRQLPTKERTALHLFYLTDQPASAAREIMGLSSSGFYKVLERAKNRVASILQNRRVTR